MIFISVIFIAFPPLNSLIKYIKTEFSSQIEKHHVKL